MCIYIMLILESDSATDASAGRMLHSRLENSPTAAAAECKQHDARCCYSRSNPGSGPMSGAQ